MNLVCRDEKLKSSTIQTLQRTFKNLIAYKLDQDVNEVFFCTNNPITDWLKEFEKASKLVNTNVINNKLQTKDIVDTNVFLKSLKFYL